MPAYIKCAGDFMNFDERFLGLVNMLGGLGGKSNFPNQNPSNEQKNGMNFDGIMKILGLMQGFQGFGQGVQSANTQSQQGGIGANSGGLDMMKILPLLTAMKSGNPFGNSNLNAQNTMATDNQKENIDKQMSQDINAKNQGGYKDKYSAISFAGNEVIYTLGKLWKTYKA
jgi:hypothetical protein